METTKASYSPLNNKAMQAKLIEYAYPTSTTATKNGFGKTGCYYIGLYPTVTEWKRSKILAYFLTEKEAKEYADNLPYPYHTWHYRFQSNLQTKEDELIAMHESKYELPK